MEVNLLIVRAGTLAGTEEKPAEGTSRQLKGKQPTLRKEIQRMK
jgi:hypothetical protein